MPTYALYVEQRADKALCELPAEIRQRLERRIDALADDPRPPGSRKLSGHRDRYRIRAGDYRVLYRVDDSTQSVTILAIGHRREIYR